MAACGRRSKTCSARALDALERLRSAEAELALQAFRATEAQGDGLIRRSISGRELIDGGFPEDVALAVAHDVSAAALVLCNGAYRLFRKAGPAGV